MKRSAEYAMATAEVSKTSFTPKKRRREHNEVEPAYPVPPVQVSSFQKPRNVVNHSYRDFSNVPLDSALPEVPDNLEDMTFPQRLHCFLKDPSLRHSVSWMPHGRAFRIVNPIFLEKRDAFRSYFQCKNYQVFLAVLNSYGFKHMTKGADRNAFYHEKFLRNLPHLTVYFGPPKNARRLRPDPVNEPDFEKITEKYPLP